MANGTENKKPIISSNGVYYQIKKVWGVVLILFGAASIGFNVRGFTSSEFIKLELSSLKARVSSIERAENLVRERVHVLEKDVENMDENLCGKLDMVESNLKEDIKEVKQILNKLN
jgi:hypothetical protein